MELMEEEIMNNGE